MFVALCGLQQCGIEEPGLAEKERFYLESVVSVLGHVLRIEGCGPKLEGLGVFPEAEGPRQGDEEGALPVSRRFTEPMGDAFRFLFEALDGECTKPGFLCKELDISDRFSARGVVRRRDQGFELRGQPFGYRHFPLGQGASARRFDGTIGHAHHMQHDIVVVFVGFVAVSIPIRRTIVDFDVAHPELSVDFDFGIEEIGAGIVVVQSRVDDFERETVGRAHRLGEKEPVLPGIM